MACSDYYITSGGGEEGGLGWEEGGGDAHTQRIQRSAFGFSVCRGAEVNILWGNGKSTSCFDIFPLSVENELLLVHHTDGTKVAPWLVGWLVGWLIHHPRIVVPRRSVG